MLLTCQILFANKTENNGNITESVVISKQTNFNLYLSSCESPKQKNQDLWDSARGKMARCEQVLNSMFEDVPKVQSKGKKKLTVLIKYNERIFMSCLNNCYDPSCPPASRTVPPVQLREEKKRKSPLWTPAGPRKQRPGDRLWLSPSRKTPAWGTCPPYNHCILPLTP